VSFSQVLKHCSQALFYPQACVLCQAWVSNPDLSPLCRHCFLALEPLERRICFYCGTPLPGDLFQIQGICSQCRSCGTAFDFARAYGCHRGKLGSVIRKFKFSGHQRLGHPLAELQATCYKNSGLDLEPDWIVPVPLHAQRKRERGFDQTLILSRALSRRLEIPVFRGLSRIQPTAPQSGLNLQERQRNVRDAFRLSQADRLSQRKVLLVDDVMTTGTTISEICQLLRKESTIHRIVVLTVARVQLYLHQ